jgi:hypothetical protein
MEESSRSKDLFGIAHLFPEMQLNFRWPCNSFIEVSCTCYVVTMSDALGGSERPANTLKRLGQVRCAFVRSFAQPICSTVAHKQDAAVRSAASSNPVESGHQYLIIPLKAQSDARFRRLRQFACRDEHSGFSGASAYVSTCRAPFLLCRQAGVRPDTLCFGRTPSCTFVRFDRSCHKDRFTRPNFLPSSSHRFAWQMLSHVEVPHHVHRCRCGAGGILATASGTAAGVADAAQAEV